MPATRQPLSVAIITLNAANQLEACLQSARFADEIVVVDSGSTDGTQALAERCGARVLQQDWLGFGPQKQFAIEAARHDWVLCLDADERVTPALQAAIESALEISQTSASTSAAPHAFRFPRCNRFLGRYLKHGEGYPDWSLRLFDRRHARWSDDAVHEKVLCDGPIGTLAGDLLHDSAESLSSYLTKQNRYTSLAADMALLAGKRSSLGRVALSPLVRFIKFYFIRQGFRDGLPGFVHIAIGCFNSMIKYAKMLERQNAAPR
ncbi:glycosyltransferase family 2 protein [Dechloromonas sp.]|uniref:glycosyltransferase family 2 protein n=1 Tax=Dechloromonas sp. TaxID=1917218 RepID=UPI0012121634|nr:glycosyltransferase family 2 protein [Dechloromonas sp.]MBU3695611.1 glycosyltransferase family 2 protein [Dechloromonas sp.]TEX46090.1 MAG: benzoate transporter [Rhodocyclaceae bacterium]